MLKQEHMRTKGLERPSILTAFFKQRYHLHFKNCMCILSRAIKVEFTTFGHPHLGNPLPNMMLDILYQVHS
jgi:hypothetical protein